MKHPARRRPTTRLLLAVADVLGVNLAFALAWWLRYEVELGGQVTAANWVDYGDYMPWGLAFSLIAVLVYWLEGVYDAQRRRSWLETAYALLSGTLIGIGILAIGLFGLRPTAQSRLMLPYAALLTVGLLGTVRLFDEVWRRRLRRRGLGVTRTLIVGAGEIGRAVMGRIVAQPDLGYRVVGFLDDDPAKQANAIGRFQPLGGSADLATVLDRHAVDLVIITLPWQSRRKIMDLVALCEDRGVTVRIVPDLFQLSLSQIDVESLHGIPLICVRAPTIQGWHFRVKRVLDIIGASLVMVLLSPLLVVLATAIRLGSPGPVLFRQPRVGRDGRLFTCFKFRSMVDGADAARESLWHKNEASGPIFKMRDDPRLTPIGRLLRRLSFDELPQLWNVLIGDMSLVGPRPPMPSEVEAYQPWHRRRLEIAPGMTGLWQVSGRSELTFDEMVMLDLYYAENWSLRLDLYILLRTLPTVLRGTGAY